MDEDLNGMSREQLIDEVKRLRAGIRQDRDSSGHDLCWGIIPNFGGCCRNAWLLKSRFQRGQTF